jgi:hypothetical protein
MGENLESLAENIKKLQSGFQGQRDTYLASGLKDKKLDFLEIYALAKQLSIELNKWLKIQGGSGDTSMETK